MEKNVKPDLLKKEKDPFLEQVEKRLEKMRRTANWVGGSLVAMGALAVTSSLFVTAFAGQVDDLVIKIAGFISTLFISLIGAFDLSSKATDTRNGWKNLNKAVLAYKGKVIDKKTLIKAYGSSEDMLGFIDFNDADEEEPKNPPPATNQDAKS